MSCRVDHVTMQIHILTCLRELCLVLGDQVDLVPTVVPEHSSDEADQVDIRWVGRDEVCADTVTVG